jgi:hypothetical protein
MAGVILEYERLGCIQTGITPQFHYFLRLLTIYPRIPRGPPSPARSKMDQPGDVQASIHFLRRNAHFAQEKPYILRYLPDTPELPVNNVEFDNVTAVTILDLRPRLDSINFDSSGIAVTKIDIGMTYEDFSDAAKIEFEYLPQLKQHVRQLLGAKSVTVIPHIVGTAGSSQLSGAPELEVTMALFKIRKRHPDFPMSTGIQYEYEQPTNIAHVGMWARVLLMTSLA